MLRRLHLSSEGRYAADPRPEVPEQMHKRGKFVVKRHIHDRHTYGRSKYVPAEEDRKHGHRD